MTMITLHNTILLRRVKTENMMGNATILENFVKWAIFTTLIRLNNFYFAIKITLNIFLPFNKNW